MATRFGKLLTSLIFLLFTFLVAALPTVFFLSSLNPLIDKIALDSNGLQTQAQIIDVESLKQAYNNDGYNITYRFSLREDDHDYVATQYRYYSLEVGLPDRPDISRLEDGDTTPDIVAILLSSFLFAFACIPIFAALKEIEKVLNRLFAQPLPPQ